MKTKLLTILIAMLLPMMWMSVGAQEEVKDSVEVRDEEQEPGAIGEADEKFNLWDETGGKVWQSIKGMFEEHWYADPLTVSGTLGADLGSSWNNRDVLANSTPFSITAAADLNINIYGFTFPIHLDFVNISQSQFTFPHPTLNINTTPTIGKWRFHLGTSSMHFTQYTYSGLNFTGVGAEYGGKKLRFAAFYGTLIRATNFAKEDNRSAVQYYADSLLGLNLRESTTVQYTRRAFGAKLGIGTDENYIDFSFMKAKDDSTSLPMVWYGDNGNEPTYRDSVLSAKENMVFGVQGKVTAGKHLTFVANLGVSVFTANLASKSIGELVDNMPQGGRLQKLATLIDKFSWFYDVKSSTQVHLAGDASAMYNFGRISGMFTYRFVQPDYISLGANQFSQNVHGIGGNANLRLFRKNPASLALSGFAQRDNMDGHQMFTNQVLTYSAAYSQTLPLGINFSLNYNGIKQDQLDGLLPVNDSTRTDNIVHTLTVTPTYMLQGTNEQSVNLNFNLTSNKNLNPLLKNGVDVSTVTFGAGYDITIAKINLGLGVNYDYSQSRSKYNNYNSHSLSLSASYTILKTDKLNLKADYSAMIALNRNQNPEGSFGFIDPDAPETNDPVYTTNNTVSFSNRIGASMSYNSNHNLSFYLSSANYSENIVIGQRVDTEFDLRFNLSYTYSFAYRIIKARRVKGGDEKKNEPQEDDSDAVIF